MSKETHPSHDVRVGQTWADNDPRNEGRTLRVERISYEDGVAVCKVLTTPPASRVNTGRRQRSGQVRIALRRFKPNRNGYRLLSEPSVIGLTADRRAYELLDFIGLRDGVHQGYAMFFAAAKRAFREHARDQRHLCAEAVPAPHDASAVRPNPLDAHADALNAAHVAVMNAPEPGAPQ